MKIYRFGKIEELSTETDAAFAGAICDEAKELSDLLAGYPVHKIVDVLAKCGRLWAATATPGLLPAILQRDYLEQRLRAELGTPLLLDGWGFRDDCHEKVRMLPRGLVLHVSAGNISLGAIDSLVMGLLTKNVNIVKAARGDPAFLIEFAKSLVSCDKDKIISRSFSILPWRGGNKEVEDVFKKRCDAILVWGGEEAVKSWRKDLPFTARLLEHGPKISMAFITEQAFLNNDLEDLAARMAHDVAVWDQSACASPQVLYIQTRPEDKRFKEFISFLSKGLDEEEKSSPRGVLDPDEEAELSHIYLKEVSKELVSGHKVFPSTRKSPWFIVVKPEPGIAQSPLNRFLYIRPVTCADEVKKELISIGPYLQTVGLEALPEEFEELAGGFAGIGVTRIARLGKMLDGTAGAPHDGGYPMSELVKWVSAEEAGAGDPIFLARFAAERSKFYKARFSKITNWSKVKLEDLPLMSAEDLYRHSPPKNLDMLTGPMEGGYLFSSGGSTGRPKYSFFTHHEFRSITTLIANSLHKAGLSPRDRVANLFVAGHLWSSFLVIDKVAECVGAVNFPIGGTTSTEDIIKYLNEFDINCVMGIPSTITALAIKAQGTVKLEKIFYAGEHASLEAKGLWIGAFGCGLIRSAGYASVDAGLIGYQCSALSGSRHHLAGTHQHLEIVEAENGVGELVVTPLTRHRMPLIRYRTGDLGRWAKDKCACGSCDPLFDLMGRCDDRIQIGGARVFTFDISSALKKFASELNFNFQVILEKDGAKEKMTVKMESLKDDIGGIRTEPIKKEIYRCCEDLRFSVEAGWISDIELAVVPAGSLERVQRTQKIRQVIDLR